MLEHYFKYPRVLRRLRGGGLGDELDCIATYLFESGYRYASAKIYLGRLARFGEVVSPAKPITQSLIDGFVAGRPTKASRIVARTTIVLARRVVPHRFEVLHREPDPHEPLLTSYADYLREVRGLAVKTREGQVLAARRVLAWWDRHHTSKPLSAMTGEHVLALVNHLMSLSSMDRTRAATGSYVRRFLRFLRWADLNDQDLARFVPRTPCYRLAHLPRQLVWEDIRKAIDAIDPATPTGSRDRAILLLLATTGIRNKELRSLVLEDIRWRDAQVRIRRTKARRDRSVPLTQEAGMALADYLLRARPDCGSRRVFLVHRPPVRPIDGSSVISRIVRSVLQQAGIALDGPAGAHLIRHSLATQLVSRRRPINEIADLLGHRSIDTTAIYVKVAVPQLAEVALPFPGDA
ncbi:site-specific integrase [Microvirga calopogonii]|uniref:site-specific integrase n=1 Tax=Microvirga calopogonii TaxID=2078013 RepID=UPI000E0D1385|nr:site-specific integrase [Microvirga calopogonii]